MSFPNSLDRLFPSIEGRLNFDTTAKILLIGETGAGKSTFINYLYNYFHRGDLNNLKIAIPCKYHPLSTGELSHNELNIHDNTQSKTDSCTQYIFTDTTTNKQYLFLDTPGLSDTRGIEQNDINMTKIIDAITQLGNLTSVIIVVNGSISRLTIHLRSVIAWLNGNIPDIILENVIVILTNVKKHESPFDLKILNLHGKVYPFYMQNGALVSDPQTWTKSIRKELQYDWNHSMNQIKLILQTVDSFKQISIDAFIQMKQIRNEIKSIIHQARLEMIQIQKIQDELSQLDLAFKQADRDAITYQDYTRHQTVEKIQLVDAPYHSTLCANCNLVCHNNCRLDETVMLGAQIFSQCLVMFNGQCQQCPNHCSYINHYHAKKTIRIKQETLHDVLLHLKEKYDKAYETRQNYQEKMLTISQTKQIIEKTLKEKIHEIKIKSIKLCQICSSFNLAQEFKYLIKQLKIESDLLRNLEIKLQTENLIKNLTKLTHSIEENQEKNRRKRSSMQVIYKEQSNERKSSDINHLKTLDLIELYHQTTDHGLITSVLNELHRRAQGKSTGPLLKSNEILIINKYLEKYKHRNIQELSYSYRKLQQKIDNIIQSNILKIADVNSELLIENFIVQILLDEKEKAETNHRDTTFGSTSRTSRSTFQSMINSFPQTKTSQTVYPPPYPNIEPLSPQTKTSTTNSTSIGFAHLISAPYPSADDPSPMPALPPDYSPIIQPPTLFRLEDYRYDSTDGKSITSTIDHQHFIPMPMPVNNQQQLTNFCDFNTSFSSNEHSLRPDVVPFDIDLSGASNFLSNHRRDDPTTIFNTDDFRLLDNARLLSMYADVKFKNNESQKAVIYQELERRCYGESPISNMEKTDLFQEKIKLNQMKTIEELMRTQAAIKQKIREYLINDDVTLINDVPWELIIEANALNHLILSKGQV